MPTYEYRKLKGRIVEKYGTQTAFAEAVGLSVNSMSKKMNCHVPITSTEIAEWSKLLDIKPEQYHEFYFS